MIRITDKSKCCGCSACVQICARHCITMLEDEEGFLYPSVNEMSCTDCHLCEDVCPVINQGNPRRPVCTYAAKSLNEEVRLSSSSGGVFSELAELVISEGGVVFGVKLDADHQAVHAWTDSQKGLESFRGSKYVQSRIGDSFIQVKKFLHEGRKVLFSGTPCQISGLRNFLRRDWDNLLTVDVACHGVPSPLVWRRYLSAIAGPEAIARVSFRDKSTGWKKYSFTAYGTNDIILSQPTTQNAFLQGFVRDLYLRPSCHDCPAKHFKSGSDITLADFWGFEYYYPDRNDDKGESLVMVGSDKGKKAIERLNGICVFETGYRDALKYNPSIENSSRIPEERRVFWKHFEKYGIDAVRIALKPSLSSILRRCIERIKHLLCP